MRAPRFASLWWLLAVAMALAGLSPLARSGEPTLAHVFERTARSRGMEYRIGRDLLFSQGERILPFLREQTGSDDWRRQALARALVFRLERPERAKAVLEALRWRYGHVQPAEDGSGITWRVQRWNGRAHDPVYEFVVRSDDAALLIDLVREWGIHTYSSSVPATAAWVCVDALAHFQVEEAIPALIEGYDTAGYGNVDRLHEALERFGPAARRALVERVETGPDALGSVSPEERYASVGTTYAAIGLGRVGGQGAAKTLLERLGRARTDHLAHSCGLALVHLGATEAIPLVFDRLLSRAQPPSSESHGSAHRGYRDFRPVLLGFGRALVPFLRARTAVGRPLDERAVATGLLFDVEQEEEAAAFYAILGRRENRPRHEAPPFVGPEVEEPTLEDLGRNVFWRGSHRWNPRPADIHIPTPLAIEIAWAFPDVPNLSTLARLEDPRLAREVVGALLSGPLHRRRAGPVVLAVAESRAPGVLDLFSSLIESEPPPGWLNSIVEATLLLGDPQAATLLRRFVERAEDTTSHSSGRFREVRPLAEEALAFFEQEGTAGLAAMLSSEHEAVRFAVARILARQGDPAGLDLLLDATTSAPRGAYEERRADVLRLGEKALPGIAKRHAETSDLRLQTIYDALRFRIEQPREAKRIDAAVQAAMPRVRSRGGPKLSDTSRGGERLAKSVGKDARPILAEYAVAGRRWSKSRVAVFALAAHGDPATIPLIVLVAPHDRPLAVSALEMYGEPGIEAAKRIPRPDPAKPAFASRGRRHVVATETLANAGEEIAAERLLDGLGEPIPTDVKERRKWRERMVSYLHVARARRDPRLVDPIIRLLEADSDRRLVQAAFDVLGLQEDARVAPLCIAHVPAHHYHSDAAMRALVRRLGKQAGPALLASFHEAADERAKLRLARALARLRMHGAFGVGLPPHDLQERTEAVAGTETLALDALGSLLQTASEGVQEEAADELARMWVFEQSQSALALLVPWVAGRPEPPGSVVIRLAEGKAEGAGPALLAAYRAGSLSRGDVAKALGDLGYEPALPFVIEGLERRLENLAPGHQHVLEVHALIGLGEEGRRRAATLLERDLPVAVLSRVALLLGNAAYAAAYEPTLKLLREQLALPVPTEREARAAFLGDLNLLAHAVGNMNPALARRELTLALMQAEDGSIADKLRSALGTIDMRHPEVEAAPTTLK